VYRSGASAATVEYPNGAGEPMSLRDFFGAGRAFLLSLSRGETKSRLPGRESGRQKKETPPRADDGLRGWAGYLTAMISISHRAPLGMSFTATQERAGLEVK